MTTALPGAGDTIAAIATAPGRGAVSLIRVSGPDAHAIARSVVRRWPARAREAVLTTAHDVQGRTLDQVLVTRFDAPASFTGEDVVELSAHGGSVVPATLLAALVERGARQALPGEFTRRAVLQGKLDLVQAEAVGDLVAATSRAAQRVALAQLDGGLSRRLAALREEILALEALVAYDIDFPEEDDGPIPRERIAAATERLTTALAALARTAPAGALVREGALVVLAGAPNVGKSSLFNALLGQARAIVTEVPGTTRDAIEGVMDVGAHALPLRLVDTAGLRETSDVVERIGIEVSERYLDAAQLVLACGDDAASLRAAVDAAARRRGDRAAIVAVRTKSDRDPARAHADATAVAGGEVTALAVSADSGEGLAELTATAARMVAERAGMAGKEDALLLTHERQRRAVARALDEVHGFARSWLEEEIPATIAAVHLRAAAGALEELIGRVDVEDVLEEVFRRFCVGK